MALTETLDLDIRAAQAQLSRLETQLDQLSRPVNIPVDVESDQALAQLRRDIALADADDIDVNVDVDGVQRAENQMAELRREVDQTGDEFTELRRRADSSSDAILRVGSRGVSVFANLKTSILGAAAGFGVFAGARALGRFAFDSIQAASDLEESLSKTNVVFGEFSDNIKVFASTGPEALGLSNAAALEMTSTFGNLFTALGLTQEAAADLAPEVVQLGSDLASFNNISVDEALTALRSGLVGEVEPLRRLGVSLNAAVVETKALELGLVGANGEVTEAGKVQARYALILEQTTNAQGDFARTADGVANRQRTLQAAFADLQSEIGQALLPAFEALIAAGPSLISLIEGIVPAVETAAASFGDFVASVQPVLDQVTLLQQSFGVFFDIFGGGSALFRQGLETFASFTQLRWGDAAANIGEASELVGTLFDRLQDRKTIIGLANDIRDGADATDAFVAAMRQVSDQNDLTAPTFARLAATAGLTNDELVEVIRQARENADAFGLDAQAVTFLNSELERLLFLQEEFSRRRPGGNNVTTPTFVAPELDPAAIAAFEAQIAGLPDIIKGGLDQAQREAAADAEGFAQGFADSLADSFSEAMQDAEGDLETDASQFVDRFIADLEEQMLFESNLAKIRKLGGVLLAEMLEAEGAESGGALAADFLKDPGEIAEFEEAGRARGVALATGELEAFLATIEAADFSAVTVPPIVIPLTFGGLPEFPTVALTAGGIGPGGVITVNIVNPSTNDIVTDSVRAGGIINGVISGQRGAQ